MNDSLLGAHALIYAGKGFPVFPVKPKGKTPLTKNGCKDATTDTEKIEAWWNRWPDANIGLATGVGQKPLLVLDVDIDHGKGKFGDETLAELERQNGPLPDTWLCLTGGGGMHYYFLANDSDLTIGTGILPGLDFRGRGGYVVAPPSIHESGTRYCWEVSSDPADGVELAGLPQWLHDLLANGKRQKGKSAPRDVPAAVAEGNRNTEMFSLACSLRAKGLSEKEITATIQEANRNRCKPPLSQAEIKNICASAARYDCGSGNSQSVKPPDFSDAGNATVFSRTYQDDLMFVDALGWLWWDGKRWQRDDHQAMAMAIMLSERMLQEAAQENRAALAQVAEATAKYQESGSAQAKETLEKAKDASAAAKAFLNHAKNLRGVMRLRSMMELSKPALVVKADQLDANPFDLNTTAGIVNLTTGQLRPHERGARCTKMTATGPGQDGSALWTDFLNTVTCGDGSLQGFLQMVAGMSLIGAVYFEGIVLAYGSGRNGKSTFFNALQIVFGEYAGSIDVKVLTTDRNNRGAALATLRGKRLVIAGELEEHQRLSVATLKQIASTDALVIEEKYRQPETVKPSHTLVVFTNFLPRVGSIDEGTWRRMLTVPFNATIPPKAGIQNYAEVLSKEAGGAILSWAIEGAVNFVRNGFKLDIPDVVAEATAEYREREDWLSNFINERCVKDPNARVNARDLFLDYKVWAQERGDYARRENDFAVAMEKAGYKSIIPKRKKHYIGLRLEYALLQVRSGEVS